MLYWMSYPVGAEPVEMICSHAKVISAPLWMTVLLGLSAFAVEVVSSVVQVIHSDDAVTLPDAVAVTIHWMLSEVKVPAGTVTRV